MESTVASTTQSLTRDLEKDGLSELHIFWWEYEDVNNEESWDHLQENYVFNVKTAKKSLRGKVLLLLLHHL